LVRDYKHHQHGSVNRSAEIGRLTTCGESWTGTLYGKPCEVRVNFLPSVKAPDYWVVSATHKIGSLWVDLEAPIQRHRLITLRGNIDGHRVVARAQQINADETVLIVRDDHRGGRRK